MQRKYLSAGLIAVNIGSFILWVIDQIGRIQTASDVYKSIEPFAVNGITINWPVIYFWAFVFSATFLVAINYDWFQALQRRRAAAAVRNWSAPYSEAVQYIAHGSRYSLELDRDPKIRTQTAIAALREAAVNGQVYIGGCRKGELTVREIPRSKLKHLNVSFAFGVIDDRIAHLKNVRLVSKDVEPEEVQFTNLFVDAKRIREFWPPLPERL